MKGLSATTIVIASILLMGTVTTSQFAFADGNDSPPECLGGATDNSGNNPTIINAIVGTIDKICIKDGTMAFEDPDNPGPFIQHSQLITANGFFGKDNCYTVSGIGTPTVTVTACQNMQVSHVDHFVGGKVGGHGGIISKTSLLVTGATLNASWMIPLLISAVGIGIFVITYKKE